MLIQMKSHFQISLGSSEKKEDFDEEANREGDEESFKSVYCLLCRYFWLILTDSQGGNKNNSNEQMWDIRKGATAFGYKSLK